MSTQFTLDDIRAAAEKKYGSLTIPMEDGLEVELVNAIRLPKSKRDELVKKQELLSGDGEGAEDIDQTEVFHDIFRLVARTEKQAEALIDVLGGDLGLIMAIFERYLGDTEAGEASGSAS